MKTLKPFLIALILIGMFSSVAAARTWYVNKDGSGDFSIIQDAVDAADSGDEIQIGPGRFDDFSVMHGNGLLQWDLYIELVGKSLSFIGSGIGQTIVGPADASVNENDAYGIYSIEGPSTLLVRGISFENLNYRGIYFSYGHLEVENCSFSGGHAGIRAKASEGAVVRNCHFENMDDICVDGTSPTSGFLVENCTFDTVYGGAGFFWGNTLDCHVRNCTMVGGAGGRVGVGFVDGATGSVSNCNISDFQAYGVAFAHSGNVECYDNVIELNEGWGVSLDGGEYLNFHDNFITSNAGCIFLNRARPMSFHNNHFLRGEGAWFVKTNDYYPYGPYVVDMSANWWGTTDTDELDEWIYDGNDNDLVWMTVNYLPLADGPVSTKSVTLDGIKAMFR